MCTTNTKHSYITCLHIHIHIYTHTHIQALETEVRSMLDGILPLHKGAHTSPVQTKAGGGQNHHANTSLSKANLSICLLNDSLDQSTCNYSKYSCCAEAELNGECDHNRHREHENGGRILEEYQKKRMAESSCKMAKNRPYTEVMRRFVPCVFMLFLSLQSHRVRWLKIGHTLTLCAMFFFRSTSLHTHTYTFF